MFEKILKATQATLAWKYMRITVEDSPWHREDNVAVHTMMTLEKYEEKFAKDRTAFQQLVTKIALLYHDFGKPGAEETVKRDDGSAYRRYAGHELISANGFQDFIMSHPDIKEAMHDAGLTTNTLVAIRFMIEHHLPYGLKKKDKRAALWYALQHHLGSEGMVCYFDMLRSDSAGRISDDHETKLQAVEDWIHEFQNEDHPRTNVSFIVEEKKPTMVLPMGVPGAGKSTLVREMQISKAPNGNPWYIFSLDILRVEMWAEAMYARGHKDIVAQLSEVDRYREAFTYCNDNSQEFTEMAQRTLQHLISNRYNIIVDNMNVSRKGRAKYINPARQAGYNVTTVEAMVPMQLAIDRQKTRGDKEIPSKVIFQNYRNTQLPMVGTETNQSYHLVTF